MNKTRLREFLESGIEPNSVNIYGLLLGDWDKKIDKL